MQCDVWLEPQGKPRLSQPARIHENLDFNDVVGCDGAFWTSSLGKKYHFMHFIDEATLFHVGIHSDRHFEAQVKAFETAWLTWAGPCKTYIWILQVNITITVRNGLSTSKLKISGLP